MCTKGLCCCAHHCQSSLLVSAPASPPLPLLSPPRPGRPSVACRVRVYVLRLRLYLAANLNHPARSRQTSAPVHSTGRARRVRGVSNTHSRYAVWLRFGSAERCPYRTCPRARWGLDGVISSTFVQILQSSILFQPKNVSFLRSRFETENTFLDYLLTNMKY